MIILDGKKLSLKINDNLKDKVNTLNNVPSLVVIQVGDNPSSNVYIKMKVKFGESIGVPVHVQKFTEDISQEALINAIEFCNQDNTIGGVIVQLPLPSNLDSVKLLNTIKPEKDVDGLTFVNTGKLMKKERSAKIAATPKGVINLLKSNNIELEGKNAVVIGRSQLVGLPLSILLTHENATVTIAHSKTKNLKDITKNADILILASGQPKMITRDFVKNGAIVVDVGTTPLVIEGKRTLVGDADFEDIKDKVSAISPVPGGVGPMTVASLFENLLQDY